MLENRVRLQADGTADPLGLTVVITMAADIEKQQVIVQVRVQVAGNFGRRYSLDVITGSRPERKPNVIPKIDRDCGAHKPRHDMAAGGVTPNHWRNKIPECKSKSAPD